MRGDNKSAESSSRKIILKVLQRLAGGDVPPESKNVQLSSGQKNLKNSDAMGTKNLMKVDTPLNNKNSSREEQIAAEIE